MKDLNLFPLFPSIWARTKDKLEMKLLKNLIKFFDSSSYLDAKKGLSLLIRTCGYWYKKVAVDLFKGWEM